MIIDVTYDDTNSDASDEDEGTSNEWRSDIEELES